MPKFIVRKVLNPVEFEEASFDDLEDELETLNAKIYNYVVECKGKNKDFIDVLFQRKRVIQATLNRYDKHIPRMQQLR